jgi:hypothetical protein
MSGKRIVDDQDFQDLLKRAKRVAVFGASKKPERPSNRIFRYLLAQGYEAIPVNPSGGEIEGVAVARSLDEIEGGVDIVDVFRNPKDLDPAIVEATVKAGASCLWLQDGVIREDIAEKAIAAGLEVVMDDCILRRHKAQDFCEI